MSEEKKAIGQLIWYKQLFDNGYCKDCNELCSSGATNPNEDLSKSIEILLNLIQKQQAELAEKDREIKKKDKIINLMSEYLASIDFDQHCAEVPDICMGCPKEDDLDGYMQCIKQYFERKVEKEDKQ